MRFVFACDNRRSLPSLASLLCEALLFANCLTKRRGLPQNSFFLLGLAFLQLQMLRNRSSEGGFTHLQQVK